MSWWCKTLQYLVFTSWCGTSCLSWFWRLKSKSMWSEFDLETLLSQCFTSVRLLCCVSARPACDYCLRALETAEENARRLSGIPGLNLPHPELCRVRPELHQACPQCQVSTIGTPVGSETRLILGFFLNAFFLWKKWFDQETYRFKASSGQSGTSTASARVDMTRSSISRGQNWEKNLSVSVTDADKVLIHDTFSVFALLHLF